LEKYRTLGQERANPALVTRHATIRDFARDPASQSQFDGILADLGVSTFQLLHSGRGFSFQKPEPLDMRMNTSEGETLLERLENADEEELADGLYQAADMRQSRVYARRIYTALREGSLKTTEDLVRIAQSIEGPKKPNRAHPATLLFLALRMWVNHEYEEVAEGIPALLECLKPGGRLAVLTFHSTEDRLVKHAFQRLAGRRAPEGQTEFYASEASLHAPANLVLTKAVTAGPEELEQNPRARSAKLRCIERTSQ
jgi:16S rRNA (cytosine1402-N4)-methyltransferase